MVTQATCVACLNVNRGKPPAIPQRYQMMVDRYQSSCKVLTIQPHVAFQCRVSYVVFVCNHHCHMYSCLARDDSAYNTTLLREVIEVEDSDNDDDVQTAKRQRVEDVATTRICCIICFEDIVDNAGYRWSTGIHRQCMACFLRGLHGGRLVM